MKDTGKQRRASIRPDAILLSFVRNGANSNMNVDGSSTPVVYKYTVPVAQVAYIERLCVAIIDNAAVNADEFGAIAGGGLDNGIEVWIDDSEGSQVIDLLDGETIKANGEWASYAGVDVSQLAGNRGVGVRWTFSKATGSRALRLGPGESFCARVNDDLTGILKFTMMIQGRITTERWVT